MCYLKTLRTSCEGRTNLPILHAHKDAFNFELLISDLRKKNLHWDRKSVDDYGSTTRFLFTEETEIVRAVIFAGSMIANYVFQCDYSDVEYLVDHQFQPSDIDDIGR